MSDRKQELLRYAATRAADRPFFMASVLHEYQELRAVNDEQLARDLGCTPNDLPRLGLCRRPDPAPGRFRADVERIAGHLGISPLVLARIVRDVDAARQLRAAPPEAGGLLAARDRDAEPEDPASPPPTRGRGDGGTR